MYHKGFRVTLKLLDNSFSADMPRLYLLGDIEGRSIFCSVKTQACHLISNALAMRVGSTPARPMLPVTIPDKI